MVIIFFISNITLGRVCDKLAHVALDFFVGVTSQKSLMSQCCKPEWKIRGSLKKNTSYNYV